MQLPEFCRLRYFHVETKNPEQFNCAIVASDLVDCVEFLTKLWKMSTIGLTAEQQLKYDLVVRNLQVFTDYLYKLLMK
jgi:hypothetical protein